MCQRVEVSEESPRLTPEQIENRERTGQLMYDEARRARDLQEKRIDSLRSRATTLLTTIGSAVVVVAGLAERLPSRARLTLRRTVTFSETGSNIPHHGPSGSAEWSILIALASDVIRPRESARGAERFGPRLRYVGGDHGVAPAGTSRLKSSNQYRLATSPELVLRDLALYHWDLYEKIEEKTIKPMAKSMRLELLTASMALLLILAGLGV